MSDRPSRLYFTGDPAVATIPGVPARDLDAADVAVLTEREYRDATAKHPGTGKALYQRTRPKDRTDDADEGPAGAPATKDERAADAPQEGKPDGE